MEERLKAASKFLIKGIYLILLIIAIAIVTNQIITVNYVGSEESKRIDLRIVKETTDRTHLIFLFTLSVSLFILFYKIWRLNGFQ